jgi:hypothetical protein
MDINKLVFGGLAVGCLAAAAGGGYLAARQGTPAANPAAVTAPATAESNAAAPKAVAESEGIITPDPGTVPTALAPVEAPAPTASRRTTSSPAAVVAERRAPATPSRAPGRSASPAATPARPAAAPAPEPASTPPANSGSMWETRPPIEPERVAVNVEPEAPPPPPEPSSIEVTIPSDAVLGLQIERTVSSESARVEDRVEARLTRDVRVGDRIAIPAGSVVQGSVSEVERGGKVRERAKLAIRFHTVILADGSRLNIRTDAVTREGASPSGESAAKIGGAAVGGAILGAILGGSRGAAIGGAVGAAGGTAATVAGGRNPAVLTAGSTVSVRTQGPVTVTIEK